MNDRVDGQSQARAVYTAGWNAPGVEIADTIQANLSNGAGAVVTITRSGNGIAEMTVDPTNEKAAGNESRVITVTVTDSNKKPISGLTVSFSITVNHSGSPSLTAYSGVTDGLGNATTVYTPGNASPDQTVSDTVEARLANGSSRSVVITRKGEAMEPLSITVAADPTSLAAGQISVVTATLKGDDNAGVTVNFALETNNSGATLSRTSSVTDGSGNAVVNYTAGSNNPTVDVQDTILAWVGNASSAVTITRSGPAAATASVSLWALPGSFSSVTTGQTITSILTATVTDNLSQPQSGVTVTFSIVSGGGTPSSPTAVTDSSGKAVISYTRLLGEPAGTNISVLLKATIPSGSEALDIIEIHL